MSTTAMTLPGPVKDKLAVLTEVERRLAAITTVDEAKDIRDQAEALRIYAKSARKGLEIQNHCALVKILAERRAGELLAQMEKSKGAATKPGNIVLPRLEGVGVSKMQAHRWQTMARVPEPVVRKYVANLDARGDEVTSAGVRRMWRELSGGSLRADADGTVTWSPDERCRWLIERLTTFLQPGGPEQRHLEAIVGRMDLEHVLARLEALRSRVDSAIEWIRRQIDHED